MKVLFYDLETSPNISYIWGQWQQNAIAHVRERSILCVSWRWLGEKELHYAGLNSFPTYYKKNPDCDYKVIEVLHDLFEQADVTIAHNGDKFDKRTANAQFIYHGFGPPATYQTVDTLKIARKNFRFNSNRLTDLGNHLGLGVKEATGGFKLWRGCMMGDPASWKKMEKYAKQDIRLLERVYKEMLPWMDGHPNYNLFTDSDVPVCPNCGGKSLTKRGFSVKSTRRYQRFQCKGCGKYSRSTTADSSKRASVV